jgi:hypothetical protein
MSSVLLNVDIISALKIYCLIFESCRFIYRPMYFFGFFDTTT